MLFSHKRQQFLIKTLLLIFLDRSCAWANTSAIRVVWMMLTVDVFPVGMLATHIQAFSLLLASQN